MNELEEHLFCECDECIREYRGPLSNEMRPYYLKSEADKVIAELKQKTNEVQTELELWRDGSIISEEHQKELDGKRHSDYKRCLAMEKWCMTEYIQSKCLDFTNTEQWYWRRWHIRWRNLAEKFKEAK